MPSLAGIKPVWIGLITAVAYSSMVIDIIQILKVHENQYTSTYPPAVVALLVVSILQMIWGVWYLARSGRGAIFKASNVAGAVLFFFLFYVGAAAATTALRFNNRYCPRDASNFTDCRGVMRGTMGLAWAMVGLNLFYLCYLAALVSKHGRWSDDLWNIPARRHANADMDKAPVH
ncbi:hypothetical protein DB88DRAFT_478074 [Papiliotrema laurentii]|uniref:MARVEL domain-containing protein n=1 Tax=Papiliotrema laurentii TaxID=5418 RepID=A0AAD9L9L3_PAPLA|nr:hypothetical protein DB88DRAFT_478074 [Papiliotrema laurentii]